MVIAEGFAIGDIFGAKCDSRLPALPGIAVESRVRG